MSKTMQPEHFSACLDMQPDVRDALANNQAVVALESTIICHGMPYPQNVETALQAEKIVRENGAIPATIAVLSGRLKAGLNGDEIDYLGKEGKRVTKASRRDLPFIVSRHEDAATTVAATMIIATMAGIKLFATGGIGGVHRGAEQSMDISADLQELAHSNVAVVCAGVKSILDIGLTLEYLETHGVPVIGYRTDTLPAFYSRSSGFPVDCMLENPGDIARMLRAKWEMGIDGGVVVANPVPTEHALDGGEIDGVIDEALQQMRQSGVTGKDTTPFLLARIAEKTGGRSLAANIELVYNNARLAAKIAVEYSHAGICR
ncbi:MAG: pseudouridine-5'-phosphate glycosidase [Proteobacteria bacterium]|nr:pseudouridine-5'-phosphate glycosidase [Pseudomonadota bacterium]